MDELDYLFQPDPEFEKLMDDMAAEMTADLDEFIKTFPVPDISDFEMDFSMDLENFFETKKEDEK